MKSSKKKGIFFKALHASPSHQTKISEKTKMVKLSSPKLT